MRSAPTRSHDATGAPRNYMAKVLNAIAKAGLITARAGPPAASRSRCRRPTSRSAASSTSSTPFRQSALHARQRTMRSQPPVPRARSVAGSNGARRSPFLTTTIADLLEGRVVTSATRTQWSPSMSPDTRFTRSRRLGWRATLAAAGLIAGVRSPSNRATRHQAREEGRKIVQLRQPSDDVSGQEVAVLTHAPDVPPPITRTHPTRVIVNLEVVEKTLRIADSVQYSGVDVRRRGAGRRSSACVKATWSNCISRTMRRARCRTTSTCTR